MAPISFPFHKPKISTHLTLTLMTLEDWTLVNVIGPDSEKYLQSQVTADITQIDNHQYLLTAHCNPQGKMLSNLILFRRSNNFAFIERHSLCNKQLTELRKYAIFSKVSFVVDSNIVLLGIAGFNSRKELNKLFSTIPTEKKQVVNEGNTTILWFEYPLERFMIITDLMTSKYIVDSLRDKALFNNSQQWLALNIEAGIPTIDIFNFGKFIPQATNLQLFGGISLEKGCYIGQEVIARINFKNANKRAMWCLIGTTNNNLPNLYNNIENNIEIKTINNNWQRIGTILAAVKLNNNQLLVQAVMNNNLKSDSLFRINNGNNTLRIKPLPYFFKY